MQRYFPALPVVSRAGSVRVKISRPAASIYSPTLDAAAAGRYCGIINFSSTLKHPLIMEQLNRIELIGIIGSARVTEVSATKVARFSVATNYVYKTASGEAVIETTWHNVSAFQSPKFPDLSTLEKGMPVHIVGRLRAQRYTGTDGTERTSYEVLAQSVEILTNQVTLQSGL